MGVVCIDNVTPSALDMPAEESLEGEIIADLNAMVERSRGVAANMSKGVQFLFKNLYFVMKITNRERNVCNVYNN